MSAIWKYAVPIDDRFDILMPEDAQILSFQWQESRPTIWVLVKPDAPKVRHSFRVFGTGHLIEWHDPAKNYIGTVQTPSGLASLQGRRGRQGAGMVTPPVDTWTPVVLPLVIGFLAGAVVLGVCDRLMGLWVWWP